MAATAIRAPATAIPAIAPVDSVFLVLEEIEGELSDEIGVICSLAPGLKEH